MLSENLANNICTLRRCLVRIVQQKRYAKCVLQHFLIIMYFSLPKDIPPHPLGGTRVRRHWSAVIYTVITGLHVLYETCIICFVYVHIKISMNKRIHKI
jgi:hypothetical protein